MTVISLQKLGRLRGVLAPVLQRGEVVLLREPEPLRADAHLAV